MTAKTSASDVLATVGMLQDARAGCADLKSAGFPMTARALEQRATIIATVVRTRRLLRALQSQPDDLRSALRSRPLAMRA